MMDETTKKGILKILLTENLVTKRQAEEIGAKEDIFRSRLVKTRSVT
jgi:hypothetical protein